MNNDQLTVLTDLMLEGINKRLLQGEQAWIVIAREVESGTMEIVADIESGEELVEALNTDEAIAHEQQNSSR